MRVWPLYETYCLHPFRDKLSLSGDSWGSCSFRPQSSIFINGVVLRTSTVKTSRVSDFLLSSQPRASSVSLEADSGNPTSIVKIGLNPSCGKFNGSHDLSDSFFHSVVNLVVEPVSTTSSETPTRSNSEPIRRVSTRFPTSWGLLGHLEDDMLFAIIRC